jgi:hypothetical protein
MPTHVWEITIDENTTEQDLNHCLIEAQRNSDSNIIRAASRARTELDRRDRERRLQEMITRFEAQESSRVQAQRFQEAQNTRLIEAQERLVASQLKIAEQQASAAAKQVAAAEAQAAAAKLTGRATVWLTVVTGALVVVAIWTALKW